MTSTPAITAIIICLNGEAFLREAIDSIRAQSETDWELIVVDDGSTDDTPQIVTKAMAEDPRIRTTCHPGNRNMGMSASRNLGVAEARGRYVAFLDADDIWLPDKLADQRKVLEANPHLGMTYGRVKIWHSWQTGRAEDDFFYDLGVDPGEYAPPVLFKQLMENRCQSPTSCGSLIRRDAIIAVGGFDPSFRTMFEDQVFYARLLAQYAVHVSDQCVAQYRSHADACTARMTDTIAITRAHLHYLSVTRAYIFQRGLTDPVLYKAIRDAQWQVMVQTVKTMSRPMREKLRGRG